MADDKVIIRVSAETKNVSTGFGDLKDEIGGLRTALQQLSSMIASMTAPVQAALDKIAEAAKRTSEAAEGAGKRAKDVSEGAAKIADGVTAGFKAVGKEIPEVGKIIEGLGVVVEGFFALCESMHKELGISFENNKEAMISLSNTIKGALAPSLSLLLEGVTSVINAFVESYNRGGMVSSLMRYLGYIFKFVALTVVDFALIIDLAIKAIVAAAHGVVGVIKGICELLIEIVEHAANGLRWLGSLMTDAVNLDWTSFKADVGRGMDGLRQVMIEGGRRARADFVEGVSAGGATVIGAMNDVLNVSAWERRLINPPPTTPSKAEEATEKKGSPAQKFRPASGRRDPVVAEHQRQADAKLEVDATYQEGATAAEQKGETDRSKIAKAAITSLASGWSQSIAKLITLQASFASTLKSLYSGLVSTVTGALTSIIEKWMLRKITMFALEKHLISASTAASILGETAKTGAAETGAATRAATDIASAATSKAVALAQISTQAALAGAGGVASMAAAPWPVDMGAPEFGAAMSAAAMGFQGMLAVPSGAGGIWDVRGGLTMLHEREMVLPAWAAQPLRNMLVAPAANNNIGFPANDGGATHNHYYNISAMDGQDVHRVLMRYQGSVARAAQSAYRNGYKPTL